MRPLLHVLLNLKATTGEVLISYSGTPLSIPLQVSLIANRHKKAYNLTVTRERN
jgi:hypothetical protein